MKDPYASETLLLGIETGGTKIVCAAAAVGNPILIARTSIQTLTPESVVADIAVFHGVVASKPDALLIAPTDVSAMQAPIAAAEAAGTTDGKDAVYKSSC